MAVALFLQGPLHPTEPLGTWAHGGTQRGRLSCAVQPLLSVLREEAVLWALSLLCEPSNGHLAPSFLSGKVIFQGHIALS